MTPLDLPASLRARIESEAWAAVPGECCGLLEGTRTGGGIAVAALHPARNLAGADDRFEIDPADHFAALRAARTNGREIVGCYHSHPDGRPGPSGRDRDGAAVADFVWLIAAVAAGGDAAIGAYLFDGNVFLPLDLSDGTSLDPALVARV